MSVWPPFYPIAHGKLASQVFNEAQSMKLHAYVIGVREEALGQTSYFLVANKSNLNFYYIIYLVSMCVCIPVYTLPWLCIKDKL